MANNLMIATSEEEAMKYFIVCFEIDFDEGGPHPLYDIVRGDTPLGNKSYREMEIISGGFASKEEAERELRLLMEESEFNANEFKFFAGEESREDSEESWLAPAIFAADSEGRLFVVTEVADDFRTFRARKANPHIPAWVMLEFGFKNIPEEVSLRKAYFDMHLVSKYV